MAPFGDPVVCPIVKELTNIMTNNAEHQSVVTKEFLGEIYSICSVQILNWGRGKAQNCSTNTWQFPSKWAGLQFGYSVSFWYGFPQIRNISFILNC
jgi:hypothetical protein